MKLIDLIYYLIEPIRLGNLYANEQLNIESESLLIYMKEKLDINSEIKLFEIEETEDDLAFVKNGIQYIQLFPIEHAIDLIESDLDLKDKGYSASEIANVLLKYRLKDA